MAAARYSGSVRSRHRVLFVGRESPPADREIPQEPVAELTAEEKTSQGAGEKPAKIARIVSLLASATEIVCALGAGDRLVGRSHECDNPEWVTRLPACTRPAFDTSVGSAAIDAEVRRRLRAGEALYEVDAGLLARLQPDLLIAQSHCEVCAVTPADVLRSDAAAAQRTLSLAAACLADIYDDVLAVGRALELEAAADRLVGGMRGRIARVSAAVRGRAPARVVVLEWTAPVFAIGNWGPELVAAAGGLSLLGDSGVHSQARAWQDVRAVDPDWLIVAPCGFSLPRTLADVPVLEALPGWSDLRAVRAGRVVLADGNRYFNRSGITVVDTVELLAEIFHGWPAGLRGSAWTPLGIAAPA